MEKNRLTGYHGTTLSAAESILSEKRFYISNTNHEWLGEGVYFFEDRRHAIGWANIQTKKKKETTAAVLAVDLIYEAEEFFDIDIPDNVLIMSRYYEDSIQEGMFSNGAPQFQTPEELKCFVSNLYKEAHPNIKVLAYTFDSTQYTGIGFAIKQRQICVSDDGVIKNIRMSYTALVGKGGYYHG